MTGPARGKGWPSTKSATPTAVRDCSAVYADASWLAKSATLMHALSSCALSMADAQVHSFRGLCKRD